eukprot:TRINITY_DN515_c0_g1_i1.p2 TRINITY_DN515_c0_g1~~TRINITY_DN515_c0_g1_i1.p2  ORF type:complete len:177 (+),score=43.47 TRINITY_DN515_c0_g1_i1:54-584(+)
MPLHQYEIVGRRAPTEKHPEEECKVFKSTVFAPNVVVGKQKFWKQMKQHARVKKQAGQVLQVKEIVEADPSTYKNYSIFFRFRTRARVQVMTKEFRAISLARAVEMMYNEMAGIHRCPSYLIDIIATSVLADEEVTRPHVKEFLEPDVKFPLLGRRKKIDRRLTGPFSRRRPNLWQ